MPQNSGTAHSPFSDRAEVARQHAEAAVMLGKVARSPFVGEAVVEPEHEPAERHHPPVGDDPRRRRNT
jgi:hypothetical protein